MVWIIFGVIAVLLLLLGAGAYFFKVAICRAPHIGDVCDIMPAKNTAWFHNYDYIMESINYLKAHPMQEVVSITSVDGLKLKGRLYLTSPNPEQFIAFFHGWHSTGFNDGAVIVRYYIEKGYNVLLVDQRARGMSQGKYTCFGVKERYDCIEWAKYLNSRYGEENIRIVLEGLSMGASTVMMAAGLELPQNVVGLLLDCGFTTPYEQFRHIIRNSMHLPEFPLLNVFALYCKWIADFDIRECDTRECLSRCTLPMAMIHGGRDDFVPTSMSYENYEASVSVDKALLVVPEAGHGTSYLHDREGVLRFLDVFLEKNFKNHVD